MKEVIVILLASLLLASCASNLGTATKKVVITKPKLYEDPVRVDEQHYRLTYPLSAMQYRGTLSDVIHKSAKLTLSAGYEKFLFFHDQDVKDKLVIVVYMYMSNQDVPWEYLNFEELDAKEYSEKEYVPLGMHPGAA